MASTNQPSNRPTAPFQSVSLRTPCTPRQTIRPRSPRPRARAPAAPRSSPAWSWTRPTTSSSPPESLILWTWRSRRATGCCPAGCWAAACRRRPWPCPWTTYCSTPSPSQTIHFSDRQRLSVLAIPSHYRDLNHCTERTNNERFCKLSFIYYINIE